jgi:hypothetical protein
MVYKVETLQMIKEKILLMSVKAARYPNKYDCGL